MHTLLQKAELDHQPTVKTVICVGGTYKNRTTDKRYTVPCIINDQVQFNSVDGKGGFLIPRPLAEQMMIRVTWPDLKPDINTATDGEWCEARQPSGIVPVMLMWAIMCVAIAGLYFGFFA